MIVNDLSHSVTPNGDVGAIFTGLYTACDKPDKKKAVQTKIKQIKLQLIKNPGNDPNEPPLLKLAKGTLTVQLYDGVSNIDSVISNWVNSTP